MLRSTLAALAVFFLVGCVNNSAADDSNVAESPIEEPIVFEADDGSTVDAFAGSFTVPENRADPDSRALTLRYVRFASTSPEPGSPIVYLAGGPGVSGIDTARGPRFALFMALREVADVIALDQRGTGESNDIPFCLPDGWTLPFDEPLTREALIAAHRGLLAECAGYWANEGVDILGYTTVQNAADLDGLRRRLGAEKISLWGISYGTHLAFEALKQMEDRIDRVVLASAEGPDQTVKLPARTDAYFDRIQAAIDTQSDSAEAYPDVKALMRRVHEKLAAEPARITMRTESGESFEFAFGGLEMKKLSAGAISDPRNVSGLLALYREAEAGDYEHVGRFIHRRVHEHDRIGAVGMPEATDLASGVTAERLARVASQADAATLGDWLNFPMPHVLGAIDGLDLGDAFRANTVTDVPTLLLSGTLDGRTYVESQVEATAGFSNLTHVIVENAGHNLFMVSPEVGEAVVAFMKGEPVSSTTITVEAPAFTR